MHPKIDMNLNDHTSSENASRRQFPWYLLPNSTYGQGTGAQPCNARLPNGFSSRDVNVSPVKARRKMIDLQLPADEYVDTDEITICSPSGRGDASYQSNSSGSCLDVKRSNGLLADLNEPFIWKDSESVALSMDTHTRYGRLNADVQGKWLEKNKSQNGWMVLDAGHGRNTQRDLHLPFHSVQVRSNNVGQPQSYPTTDYNNVISSGERAYREMEVCSMNPQASYDSYVESTVASSNAPRLHNDYHPDFFRPWSHQSTLWENPRSSSLQKLYPVQTNPFMNFVTHARGSEAPGSSFETRSYVSNGIYHGFSSGSKEAAFNYPSGGFKPNASLSEAVKHQSFESLQGPKKQESSTMLPWLKPKPTLKSEVSNGFLDLNASTNQFMDGTEAGDGLNIVSPQKSLRSSVSCSNNANTVRVEMINPQSSRNFLECPIFEEHTSLISHSLCVADQHKEVNHLVKLDFDINLPYGASVSVDQHGAKSVCVKKEEGNKTANVRHYFDLNSCANEDDEVSGLRVKTKGTFWIDLEAPPTLESEEEEDGESSHEKSNKGQDGISLDELIKVAAEAIVAISLSDHPDDAASSSTDAASKSRLSWFADIIITSRGDELERKIDAAPEDCSSWEIDYFETMTLSLQPTKEEDYMPEPLVPVNLISKETGLNRPRRGQARRGRPKRDFQRDTLPGLSSLSRKEITEDIQLFSGLMKAREHTSGASVRQNSKRSKRTVSNISQASVCQSMNESVSVVGLEESKLTGWGQATRRPRRQRCPPAGDLNMIVSEHNGNFSSLVKHL